MLNQLTISDEYRSDEADLVHEFYIPCLLHSNRYDRSVGYFTSSVLCLVTRGLKPFVEASGRMRLIASPFLNDEDTKAIRSGYEQREKILQERLSEVIEQAASDEIYAQPLKLIAWMIAHEQLDIKIAVPRQGITNGLYHEKLGIFYDEGGNFITFTGSPNETRNGLTENFEQIDIFASWDTAVGHRAYRKRENFERLWNDQTPFLNVLPFPEAVKQKILAHCPSHLAEIDNQSITSHQPSDSTADSGSAITMLEHQKAAIRQWFQSNGRGILEMATGSGKTYTALFLARKLSEQLSTLCIVIICPYIHLTEQWSRSARKFGFSPVLCHSSRDLWLDAAYRELTLLLSGQKNEICLITTNATFSGSPFQVLLSQIPYSALVVGDEVHNLGAKSFQDALPQRAHYRLGLSATPDRWFDNDGTQNLRDYFGQTVFHFSLRDALNAGCLTPYRYYPIIVFLTDEEEDQYHKLSRDISKAYQMRENEDDPDTRLSFLLLQRARLVGSATEKLPKLRDVLQRQPFNSHALFYCGDGQTESDISETTMRQLNATILLLGADLGYRVHAFTSDESRQQREELLKSFENGDHQALVAIRCLDEGVDVPATRTAYILASSTNPRQSIQRLGRILRKAQGKPAAAVYDFIVVPKNDPEELPDQVFNVERRLLTKELRRVRQFAELALNGPQALSELLPFERKYHILSDVNV